MKSNICPAVRGVTPIQQYDETPRSQFAGHAHHTRQTAQYWDVDSRVENGSASFGDKISDAAGNAAEKAGELWDDVRDKAAQAQRQISEGIADVAESAKDQANAIGRQANDAVGQTANQMSRQAMQTQGQLQDWREQAENNAYYLNQHATQAGERMQRTINDNPLSFGAVALAVGAAIGLVLPATRKENELLGKIRDQVLDSAQTISQEVMSQAREVVDEVAPQVQAMADSVIQDVREVGENLAGDVESSLQSAKSKLAETGQDVKEAAKETARHAQSQLSKTKPQRWRTPQLMRLWR